MSSPSNNQSTDLSEITDLTELRAMRGDQYQIRENAQALMERSSANIQNLNARIEQLGPAEKPEDSAQPETPADQPSAPETPATPGE